MSEPAHAVFLSYASQDAAAAQRICEALRGAGIEVFLDQSELRGGDSWDRKIRHEIHNCALFVPIISRHTQERLEGYFRHEWKLAVERTHHMAEQRPFLVPVVIDDTREQQAYVPDAFRAVQWTRLPGGDTPPAFAERITRLRSPQSWPVGAASPETTTSTERPLAARQSRGLVVIGAAVVGVVLAYLLVDRLWLATRPRAAADGFAPPPHSIAVLPFVNMSADKDQEYLSDGITEELLNSLTEIDELQVAARTSAFSFKGKDTDIGTIARKLNVGAVLEGSVRRSGNTVRITAQLINATTGFHLWSHTYDRSLGDVLQLETELAGSVASALKVSLLTDAAKKIQSGGTRDARAFDAYLRGRKLAVAAHGNEDLQAAIAAYTEAIELDPNYGLAFANRSTAFAAFAANAPAPLVRETFDKAQADAIQAIRLAPDLVDGYLALAYYFDVGLLDFSRANQEYERALALAPGNARVLRVYGIFAVRMGRADAGIAAARRAVVLDPLNRGSQSSLSAALYLARRNEEALAAAQATLALDPGFAAGFAFRGLAQYATRDFERARASCESKPDYWVSQECLAVTYDKLGRHADAEGMLGRIKASAGDAAAFQYAAVYAQWGDFPRALDWLDTALRLRDPGLENLKVDPLIDPLRHQPRFQAIERTLNFPN